MVSLQICAFLPLPRVLVGCVSGVGMSAGEFVANLPVWKRNKAAFLFEKSVLFVNFN
jgi:hypothetical protein